jgi:hypothetical protein
MSDFIECLSIETNDAGLRPIITYQLLPKLKNIVIENFNEDLNKNIKELFSKNDPRLIMVATEIVQDGMLNSAAPGEGAMVAGW